MEFNAALMPAVIEFPASYKLHYGSAGEASIILSGQFDTASTPRVWRELEAALIRNPPARLDVDASGIERCDGAGLALLHFLSMGGPCPLEIKATVKGLRPGFMDLYERFSADDYLKNQPEPLPRAGVAEQAGKATVSIYGNWKDGLGFLGETTSGIFNNLSQPKRMRWGEVWRIFEKAGVNALPIISLISLLIGLIIAFEASAPFQMFGAQVYIANMLGIIMARELAGLITAIILAGRSGSAFAAELGTMKVNEEINALETFGLSPIRFLVAQRIVAGILLTPLLTIFSIAVSIAGGVLVMLTMGIPLITIYNQMAESLRVVDIVIGVGKGFIFGALIAGIGCMKGFQTKRGPSAVGESATNSVVTGILMIIVADAVVAVILYILHI